MSIKLVTYDQALAALKASTTAKKSTAQIDIICDIASTEAGLRSLCAHPFMTISFLDYFEGGEVKDILKAAVVSIKHESVMRPAASVTIKSPLQSSQ